MFVQQLWLLQFGWDDKLPKEIEDRWDNYSQDLANLEVLLIPRHTFKSHKTHDYHGFCDASGTGLGACVYIRTQIDVDRWQSILLCAKAKVTPNKQYSIPRLELCSMFLLVHLITKLLS